MSLRRKATKPRGRNVTQTRTVRKAKHRRLDHPRRNQAKRHRKAKSRAQRQMCGHKIARVHGTCMWAVGAHQHIRRRSRRGQSRCRQCRRCTPRRQQRCRAAFPRDRRSLQQDCALSQPAWPAWQVCKPQQKSNPNTRRVRRNPSTRTAATPRKKAAATTQLRSGVRD